MIPMIIFCAFLFISLTFFILLEITGRDNFEIIGGITGIWTLVFGLIAIISLTVGYKCASVKDKAVIEYRLRKGDIIAPSEAYDYNEKLKRGDNYWCRFTLRDPSDYIDITEVEE